MKTTTCLAGVVIGTACLAFAQAPLTITEVGLFTRAPEPAGLSGIAYAGGDSYFSVNDSGGTLHPMTIKIDFATGSITGCVVEAAVALGGVDLEGVAYDPANGSVYTSDEADASIRQHTVTGEYRGALPVPANLTAFRNNFSLESLSMRGNGLELWTCNEEALYNATLGVNDGSLSTTTQGSLVRLTRFARPNVRAPWVYSGQWAYRTDPIRGNIVPGFSRSGVADLCALPDGTLLVLEREFSVNFFYAFKSRIYRVGVDGATDIGDIDSLAGAAFTPVEKTLLWDKSTTFSNFEGLCLGPRLDDGSLSLVLISDGDDDAYERVFALKLAGLDVWSLDIASAHGVATPVGGPYRLLAGTSVQARVDDAATEHEFRHICGGWSRTGSGGGSGGEKQCTFTLAGDTVLTWTPWTAVSTLETPIADTFEEYAPGRALDGVAGWRGDGVVQACVVAASLPPGPPVPEATHAQVLRGGWMARSVEGVEGESVNVDFLFEAMPGDMPEMGSAVQTAFRIAGDGRLLAWHADGDGAAWTNRWSALGDAVHAPGDWIRISVAMDYDDPSGVTWFQPRVNGSLCPTTAGFRSPADLRSPGTWYRCANNPGLGGSGLRRMTRLDLLGEGALDDLVVSRDAWAHSGPDTVNGVPLAWFDGMGLARNPPEDADFDGDGFTDWEEFTAGTDPADPQSAFRITSVRLDGGTVNVTFLGNDSGADTPYIVERASDLATGDWTVVDDAVPRAAVPATTNTWSEPMPAGGAFYRLRAQ